MEVKNRPIAKAELLIRRPVTEVFEAFAAPDVITKFWFERSTGRLECGKTVRWHWESCNLVVLVRVRAIEKDRRILIEWGQDGDNTTTVEWIFTPRSEDTTYVSVANKGFVGSGDEIVHQALDATGGFGLVLAAAKAYLEHSISLNIVADRF